MAQRTGSVYLDAPTPPRRRTPVPRVKRTRIRLAGAATAIGLVSLVLALSILGLRLLVFDPGPVTSAFDASLADPIGRLEIENWVAEGIENDLIGPELTELAAAFDVDVAEESTLISQAILDDAEARDELRRLVVATHAHVLLERDATTLDLGSLTDTVRAIIERESPRLAAIVAADTTIWAVDDEAIPDLTGPVDLANRVFPVVVFLILLVPLGMFIHPQRHWVLNWAGRTVLGFGLLCSLGAVGLPYLGRSLTGSASVEIAIRSESLHLLAPAALAGIIGMGLVSLATIHRRSDERTVHDEGAAAALGYNEPPLWRPNAAPSLDLPSRGLVDVSHPLTNI